MAQSEISFEEAVAEMEEAITRLEEGQLSLEETLRLFEHAQELVTLCNAMLDDAELRLKQLGDTGDRGLQVTDYSDDPATES